jgi:3'(2'), 5'-bisphosphate nucleotidase
MPIDPPALLPRVEGVARAAGEAIMAVYAGAFAVQHKADASPLTEADLAADRIIRDGLAKLIPDIPILSEESAPPDLSAAPVWWCVDPLDGTREFVSRNGQFAVCIALVTRTGPLLGVVHGPVANECYAGAIGHGATRNGVPITARPMGAKLAVVASQNHLDPVTRSYLDALPPHDVVHSGSALKLARVAEGLADLYPRAGEVNEWDLAAGHALVVAAGGSVTDWDGLALDYGRAPFKVRGFIARGLPPSATAR